MYVDGHKAASDVRDEFVSVTERLMDELDQCYNVLPQLDINNTIAPGPEGEENWFLGNERTVRSFAASWLLNALLRIFAMSIITPKRKVLRMSVQDCWRPPL